MNECIGYFSGCHIGNNVFSFLERHLKEKPDLKILQWVDFPVLAQWKSNPGQGLPHSSITTAAFTQRIKRIAAGYNELGIKTGDRVIIFLPMSVDMYSAMFALQMIGAVPVFLDSWARRNQLGTAAEIVQAKGIVSFEKAFQFCKGEPALDKIPVRISAWSRTQDSCIPFEQLLNTPSEADPVKVQQEHTALITFTTGSSGKPKGADRTHRFLAAQHYAINSVMPYNAGDVDLPVFPIFSLNNIAAGVSTVIPAIDAGSPAPEDAPVLNAQIEACGITCMTLNPWLLNEITRHCIETGKKIDRLRRVVAGGAAISRDQVKSFISIAPCTKSYVLYGSTEVEPIAHIGSDEMINAPVHDDPEIVEVGVNVGHIVEGLSVRCIQVKKEPVIIKTAGDWGKILAAEGDPGELIVTGEHVCRNYWNDTDAFARAKIVDTDGTIWHRTGDIAIIDDKGNVWIVGRIHNVIRRNGQYLFPVRAELVMKKLMFVSKCAFVGIPDPVAGERACCAVTVHEQYGAGDRESMKREILRIMEKNCIPVDMICFRDSIPMDPRHHSKVEYDVLRKEIQNETIAM